MVEATRSQRIIAGKRRRDGRVCEEQEIPELRHHSQAVRFQRLYRTRTLNCWLKQGWAICDTGVRCSILILVLGRARWQFSPGRTNENKNSVRKKDLLEIDGQFHSDLASNPRLPNPSGRFLKFTVDPVNPTRLLPYNAMSGKLTGTTGEVLGFTVDCLVNLELIPKYGGASQ